MKADNLKTIGRLSGDDKFVYFSNLIANEDLSDYSKKDSFSQLLINYHSKLQIVQLLELKTQFINKFQKESILFFNSLIKNRLEHFTEQVKKPFKLAYDLKFETFSSFIDELSVERSYKACTLNQLAVLVKEIPANNRNNSVFKEALYNKIYSTLLPWAKKKTRDNFIGDKIDTELFYYVQQKMDYNISHFDPTREFEPYIKKILMRKFFNWLKENAVYETLEYNSNINDRENSTGTTSDSMRDEDTKAYIIISFITITLELFIRKKIKPHKKLIFWHSNTYFTNLSNNTQNIHYDDFFEVNMFLKLFELWDGVMENLNSNFILIDEFTGTSYNKDYLNYSELIYPQFRKFEDELNMKFSDKYKESEYIKLRIQFPADEVGSIVLKHFFINIPQDNLKKVIAHWNYLIKESFH